MKKISLLILIITCFYSSLNAQWILQNSGTANPIRDIQFLNSSTGFFCGDGVIGKTTNGGQNWILLNHPATNKFLYSINPIDENIIYCAGWFETILKSTNGGLNWQVIRNGTFGQGASYWSSFFLNAQTGWIAGSSQKILKTTNGGITIDSIYAFIGNIRDMYFKDASTGILCGEGGTLWKSTNGGLNWYEPNIQLNGNLYNFHQLSTVNDSLVWIIGNINPVYRSTDFGENWDSIGYVVGSHQIYDVHFLSDSLGWAGGTFGRMFKSTNGGFSWQQENTIYFDGYYSNCFFLNDTVGWICGNGGRIQFTESGGETLTNILISSSEIPERFNLTQNYPNPFNSQTTIEFEIPSIGDINLIVIDVLGQIVDEFNLGLKNAGKYKILYSADNLTSGVYFYQLRVKDKFITKKFTLIK